MKIFSPSHLEKILERDSSIIDKELRLIKTDTISQQKEIQHQRLNDSILLEHSIHKLNEMNPDTSYEAKTYEDVIFPEQLDARKVRATYLTAHIKRKPIQYYKPVCKYCNCKLGSNNKNKQYINLYRHFIFMCYTCYTQRKIEHETAIEAIPITIISTPEYDKLGTTDTPANTPTTELIDLGFDLGIDLETDLTPTNPWFETSRNLKRQRTDSLPRYCVCDHPDIHSVFCDHCGLINILSTSMTTEDLTS
jgi:hypothetical protein